MTTQDDEKRFDLGPRECCGCHYFHGGQHFGACWRDDEDGMTSPRYSDETCDHWTPAQREE